MTSGEEKLHFGTAKIHRELWSAEITFVVQKLTRERSSVLLSHSMQYCSLYIDWLMESDIPSGSINTMLYPHSSDVLVTHES